MSDRIVAAAFAEKTGEGDFGTWVRRAVKDKATDHWFSTFDEDVWEPISGAEEGDVIELDYTTAVKNGRTQRTITRAELVNGSAPTISNQTEEGETDWDLIGLRKTRCVLWEAMLEIAMQAGIAGFSKAMNGEYDSGQLGGFVARYGSALRQIAEADIYLAAPVENADSWIPFLTKKTAPKGEDISI